METARMALAPSLHLFGVPSSFDHAAVERALVGGVKPGDSLGDFAVHVGDGFENALAEIARFIAVAQLEGFVFAGGSAAREPQRGRARRLQESHPLQRWDCRANR